MTKTVCAAPSLEEAVFIANHGASHIKEDAPAQLEDAGCLADGPLRATIQPMAAETASPQTGSPTSKASPKRTPVSSTVIHRVCIQCNNMFRVTPDKFDAKQCPACHKG